MKMRTVLRMFGGTIVLVLAWIVFGGVAYAESPYRTSFVNRYGNTGTQAASCKICHGSSNNGGSLNSYGRDFLAACGGSGGCLGLSDVTAQLAAVENLNSDGVGGTNITEIRAGAQPGWCAGAAPCDNNGQNPAAVTVSNSSPASPVTSLTLDPVVSILWQNTLTGDVHVYLMNGTAVASGTTIAQGIPLAWKVVGTGDFGLGSITYFGNSDGQKDILWQNTSTGDVNVWRMTGTTISSNTAIAQGINTFWKVVGTGDFNKDGRPDILWQNTSTGDVNVWLWNGTAVSSNVSIAQGIDTSWKIVGVGDFNGDGTSNILWKNTTTGDVHIWFMNGTTATSNVRIQKAVPSIWEIAGTQDFDGDGKSDIIWHNTSTGDVAVWLMNGTTIASQTTIVQGTNTSWSVVGPR